jgi:hypothetical protein
VSPALAAELAAAHRKLGGGFVAVRSSGIDEDGAATSFAGQHDTFLFVDADGIADAVVKAGARRTASARRRTARRWGSAAPRRSPSSSSGWSTARCPVCCSPRTLRPATGRR